MVKFCIPFFTPCKELDHIYEQLEEKLIGNEDILLTSINILENEVAGLNIQTLPTVILFQAGGDGRNKVEYKGNMVVDELLEFVMNNYVPVNLDNEL